MSMKEVIFSMMIEALENIDEAVEVSHDRYIRSHGKKASGSGGWFFTHKSGEVNNLDDEKEVHFKQGKFSDAAKSAKKWAKQNGHRTVYVMEEVEIEEGFGAAIKKAEASRQRALKKAASMVKKGFSHEAAAKNHDVSVADLKKHLGEDAEQIDELSKATLGSYIKKAGGTSLDSAGAHMADYGANKNQKSFKKGINRAKGVMKAADRLTKEEVEQIDEISKSTLGSYVKESVEQIDEISRDLARSYIRKAAADNKERKADVMKPFNVKDMEKNVSAFKKMKSREKGIETAGKKAYGIGGEPKVPATE